MDTATVIATLNQIAEGLNAQAAQMLADNSDKMTHVDKLRRAAAFTLQVKAIELIDRAADLLAEL